jgi:hypothetical protein
VVDDLGHAPVVHRIFGVDEGVQEVRDLVLVTALVLDLRSWAYLGRDLQLLAFHELVGLHGAPTSRRQG